MGSYCATQKAVKVKKQIPEGTQAMPKDVRVLFKFFPSDYPRNESRPFSIAIKSRCALTSAPLSKVQKMLLVDEKPVKMF